MRFSSSRKWFPKTPPSLEPAWRASGHSPVLDTDRLDCYLLHWRGRHPLEETIAGFEDLQRAGKILSWGVSDVPDLRDALAIAGQGEGRLACNSVLFIPFAGARHRARGVAVVRKAWCRGYGVQPLRPWEFPGVRYRGRASARKDCSSLRSNSPSSGAGFSDTPPVALRDPQGIPPAHAEENAGAGDLQLSDSDVALIDAVFPRGPQPRALPVL
jgi:Aldo/keto reductase family